MIILNGIGVFKDIAFGTLFINKRKYESIEKYSVVDTSAETDR